MKDEPLWNSWQEMFDWHVQQQKSEITAVNNFLLFGKQKSISEEAEEFLRSLDD